MADLIRVFISHKKRLTPAGQPDLPGVRSREAEILWHVLTSHGGYQPWYDREGIPPGRRWEAEIYRALLRSDVMVVLIGPGTSDSTWVQREITLAKALGVTIIPIGLLRQPPVRRRAPLNVDHPPRPGRGTATSGHRPTSPRPAAAHP